MRLCNISPALPTRKISELRAKGSRDNSRVSRIIPSNETSPRSTSHQLFDVDIPNVPTAHGYESDDSVAALEKVPSRYDVSCALPDDFAIDDKNNDKYSHVGGHLAALSDDSASVQWKSFDEFDERDPANQCYDPLQFDRDGEDWEENYEPRDDDDDEGQYSRINNARQMKSLLNEVADKNDDDEEVSEDLSSLAKLMNTEANDEYSSNQKRKTNSSNPSIRNSHGRRNGEYAARGQASQGTVKNSTPTHTDMPISIKQSVRSETKQNPAKNYKFFGPNEKSKVKEQKPRRVSPLKGLGKFRRRNQNSQRSLESNSLEYKEDRQQPDFEDLRVFKNDPPDLPLQPVRSILKQSSFASRPEDVSVVDEEALSLEKSITNQKEPAGVFEFFSNLLGTNAGAGHTNQNAKRTQASDPDSSYVKNSCGIFQLDGQEPQDHRLGSKLQGCKEHSGATCTNLDQRDVSPKDKGDATASKGVTEELQLSAGEDDIIFNSRSPTSNSAREKDEKTSKMSSLNEKSEANVDIESRTSQEKSDPKGNEYVLWCLGNRDTPKAIPSEEQNNKSKSQGETDQNDDTCQDQIIIQCIRDNDCRNQVDIDTATSKRDTNALSCQQAIDFMDDVMTADEPERETIDITPSSVTARELSLDDRHQSRRRSNRTFSKDLESQHEIPIKTISIPSSRIDFDSVGSESTDLYSRSRSKRSGLYVDTKLEDGMKEMQHELGGKKTSLFSRMKRANGQKNKGYR